MKIGRRFTNFQVVSPYIKLMGKGVSEYLPSFSPTDFNYDLSNGGIIMKEFSLEEYLANPNRRIVIRDGRAAKILCTDRNDERSIVALVTTPDSKEQVCCYFPNGKYYKAHDDCRDLIFAPENKEGWVNVFLDSSGSGYKYAVIFNSEQEARNDVVENERCGYITTTKIEWEE